MKVEFLTHIVCEDGKIAKYSPAEKHLAYLLRNLKCNYKGDYNSFEKWMSKNIDDKSFLKSECHRIWDAMHSVKFYIDGKATTALDTKDILMFPSFAYRNFSNFFEDYAKQLFEEGDLIQPRGRVKGKIYPDSKSVKVEEVTVQSISGLTYNEITGDFEPVQETSAPIEESTKKANFFDGYTLEELRTLQLDLTAAITAAEAEVRNKYNALAAQIEDLKKANPWL